MTEKQGRLLLQLIERIVVALEAHEARHAAPVILEPIPETAPVTLSGTGTAKLPKGTQTS